MWPSAAVRWALLGSLAVHVSLMFALSRVTPDLGTPMPRLSVREWVDVEPIGSVAGAVTGHEATDTPPRPEPGGPETVGALDQDAREGRGGDGASLERATRMFSFVSSVSLQDSDLNNLSTNQFQRIHTARTRATQEERRATPHPGLLETVLSGEQGHRERRKKAAHDATEGLIAGTQASAQGAPKPREASDTGRSPAELSQQGAATAAVDRGILGGRGARAGASAKLDFERPNVDRGAAATTAEALDPQVRDDVDAELLAARLQRSMIDASVQRASQQGAGLGGSQGGTALGEHGTGEGARATPFLPGRGDLGGLDTRDSRYVRWFVEQRDRVQRELVFPNERALAKDQGTTVLSIVVGRDGRLRGTPRLVRSSGFADFDSAAFSAIRRAAPFAPIPAELAPELTNIALLIPIAFSNPMVQ